LSCKIYSRRAAIDTQLDSNCRECCEISGSARSEGCADSGWGGRKSLRLSIRGQLVRRMNETEVTLSAVIS
jgi:hypothetical protein